MHIRDATNEALDSIVATHGHHWREDYRQRFIALAKEVAECPAARLASAPAPINRTEQSALFSQILTRHGLK